MHNNNNKYSSKQLQLLCKQQKQETNKQTTENIEQKWKRMKNKLLK